MPNTYEPIATASPSSNSYSYTFSSIPSTYTDLILVVTGYVAAGAADVELRMNSDTGSNYDYVALYVDTSAVSSYHINGTTAASGTWYGNMNTDPRHQMIIHFFNYANATTYKNYISRSIHKDRGSDLVGGTWKSTSAITSITVISGSSVQYFNTGTVMTLYGIKAA